MGIAIFNKWPDDGKNNEKKSNLTIFQWAYTHSCLRDIGLLQTGFLSMRAARLGNCLMFNHGCCNFMVCKLPEVWFHFKMTVKRAYRWNAQSVQIKKKEKKERKNPAATAAHQTSFLPTNFLFMQEANGCLESRQTRGEGGRAEDGLGALRQSLTAIVPPSSIYNLQTF